jgi:hypothetical protein
VPKHATERIAAPREIWVRESRTDIFRGGYQMPGNYTAGI